MRDIVPNQTVEDTLLIAVYELGTAIKHWIYSKRYPKNKEGHLADMKAELSDALTMIRLIVLKLGFDLEEMFQLGEKRFTQRVRDVAKHGDIKELTNEDIYP